MNSAVKPRNAKTPSAATPLGAIWKVAKWPAIGALIGGGALLVGRVVGPAIADDLGASAGAGFARGMADAQERIASIRRSMNISGWGKYR